jgi:hypothetical protein
VTDGLAGVTERETSVAAVTFNVAVPVILPDLAEMVEVPTPAPVARPLGVIVATVVVPELQVTLPVMFAVVLSLKVPVAVNC